MTTPVKRESAQSEGFGDTDSPVRKGNEKSPLKRTATLDAASESGTATPNKKKRRSAKERSANDEYSPENKLVDSLRPGLLLVMVGLNPGLNTAQTGHAYSHPSNRFWHLLFESGITPKKHVPSETHALQDLYSIGNTNICTRPTRDGSGLTKEEQREGATVLDEKIRNFRPAAICIVGKGVWEYVWLGRFKDKKKKDFVKAFHYGWQDPEAWLGRTVDANGDVAWMGAKTFVATTTSGLSTTPGPKERLEIWKPLGEWFTKRRLQVEATVTVIKEPESARLIKTEAEAAVG